jgi:DNA-binding NarL/FixJ family response regulator
VSDPPTDNNRVLLVDDDPFNRAGISLYLGSHGYATLEAGDEATAIALAEQERPWAAVVDIVIPATARGKAQFDQSVGLRLVRRLKALYPVMGIVIFSAHEDRGSEVWDMVREGVRGIAYLLKGVRPERLLQALHDTAAGHVILDGIAPAGRPRLGVEILSRLSPDERPWVERAVMLISTLTDMELKVALLLAASQTTQGIADALNRSLKTVEGHTTHVYEKLGLAEVDRRAPHLRKSTLLAKAFMIYELLGNKGDG